MFTNLKNSAVACGRFVKEKSGKILTAGGLAVGSTVTAMAQTADPVETVTGANTIALAAFVGFAGISASAFVFRMVIAYAGKGKK